MSTLPLAYEDILAAQTRLAGIAHRTPVLTSSTADHQCGGQLFFKCETFQRVGAFKIRGAYNTIAQLAPTQRQAGVVAYSSGNHGQAVALAAHMLGVPALVLMPQDAPAIKQAATRGYGAEVRHYDRYRDDPVTLVAEIATRHGMAPVLPFDDPRVMAGQGTVALELMDEVTDLDIVLAPCGGGGLLAGTAMAVRHRLAQARVYGVEPDAGNDVQQSLQRGERVRIDTPQTIADAAQTRQVGEYTFPVIQALVEGIVTVSDDELKATLRFMAERMKLVVEPTGALAAAAVLHGKVDVTGKRVGVVVTGGNIDAARFASLIADH